MPRPFRVLALVVLAVVCSASGIVARQNQAGLPTLAKVYVLNAARSEAISVKIVDAEPVSVLITGVPTVAAQTTVVRQRWEYRTVTVARGVDPVNMLNALGNDFWETTDVMTATADGGLNIVVKRPKL